MFRKELPRVYELLDQTEDPDSLRAYFQNFDNSLRDEPSKMQAFRCLEKELEGLDSASWDTLKSEVVRQKKLGWTQLFDKINEIKGYIYLASVGCKNIQFIPRSSKPDVKTPDLQGMLGPVKVLCEVKTIRISGKERGFREGDKEARTWTNYQLEQGFFTKLRCDLLKAAKQLNYDAITGTRRIAYIIINFDDWIGNGRKEYFEQIEQFLSASPVPGIEIECYAKTVLGEMHLTVSNR